MRKMKWMAPLFLCVAAVSGVAYANAGKQAGSVQEKPGYICPLTGEELPCPACCPANKK
mgnify:CR=1 FL=1